MAHARRSIIMTYTDALEIFTWAHFRTEQGFFNFLVVPKVATIFQKKGVTVFSKSCYTLDKHL